MIRKGSAHAGDTPSQHFVFSNALKGCISEFDPFDLAEAFRFCHIIFFI
jgi:hypothetical protein